MTNLTFSSRRFALCGKLSHFFTVVLFLAITLGSSTFVSAQYKAWGWNFSGQLGIGNTLDQLTPVNTNFPADVIAFGNGYWHSLAIRSNGTVQAAGDNKFGQLGNNTTTISTMPVSVSGLTNVIQTSGGFYHSLALKADGTVWSWGSNANGQIGDETTTQREMDFRSA
jgi:alpha-tubulin suppressor-like RCC1 family protein